MRSDFQSLLEQHIGAMAALRAAEPVVVDMAQVLVTCFTGGGTLYLCGNGGSAADCQHFAAELVGRFKRERPGLPVIALTTDSSALTAIGNDYGFDKVFSRQLSSLARHPSDVLLCISTSGNSRNVLEAARTAARKDLPVLALTGSTGGALADHADLTLRVPDNDTARVQEAHIFIIHALCTLVEEALQ